MTDVLPAPLVPAEVDLRDVPFPLADMAAAFAKYFGVPIAEAEAAFREAAARTGILIEEVGHG